jgi:hypothetical protein
MPEEVKPRYPRQMYKGSYTPDALSADEKVVKDAKEERDARNKGFLDGNEFFSKPPSEQEG